MVTRMFSLFDTKAAMFNIPFCFPAVGQAVRAVMDMCSDQNTIVARHPEDFVLYELGSFDDATGVVSSIRPENHGTVVSFFPSARAVVQREDPVMSEAK